MTLQVGDIVTCEDQPGQRFRVAEVQEQHGIRAYRLEAIVETADEVADRLLDGIRQAERDQRKG